MNLKTSYALAGTVKKHSAAAGGFEISHLTDNRNGRLYLVVKRKSWRTSNRKTLMGKLLKRKHSIQGQPRLLIDHVIIISFSVAQMYRVPGYPPGSHRFKSYQEVNKIIITQRVLSTLNNNRVILL